MTLAEYEQKKAEIDAEADAKKKNLLRDFCLLNNPYKKGDIIFDHTHTIEIESIKFSWGLGSAPYCVYEGPS